MRPWLPEPSALRWGPLLAISALAFNLRGAVTVVPPLIADLQAEIGLTAFGASVLGMLPTAVFALAGLGGSAVISRLGAVRAAWIAMFAAAVAEVARALTGGPIGFLSASALAIAGLGVGNVVVPPLVKRYFPGRLGLVTGIYVVVLQIGTALPSQLSVPLSDSLGWRWSVGIWALPALVAALAWFARERMDDVRAASAPASSIGGGESRLPLAALGRSPVAWAMATLFGMQSLMAYSVITWLPSIFRDAGQPATVGGTGLAVYAIFQIPMSLLAPMIAARVHNVFWLIVGFVALYAASFAGLATAPGSYPLVWAAMLGMAGGPFPLALALIGLRARTHVGAAALSAFTQGLGYTVACTGPLVTGLLHDATGGWTMPITFLAVLLIPMILASVVLARPVLVEDDLAR